MLKRGKIKTVKVSKKSQSKTPKAKPLVKGVVSKVSKKPAAKKKETVRAEPPKAKPKAKSEPKKAVKRVTRTEPLKVKPKSEPKKAVKGVTEPLKSNQKVKREPKTVSKEEPANQPLIKDLKSKLEKDLLAEKALLEQRIAAIEFHPSEATGDFGDISSALSDEDLKMIERERLIKQLEKVKQVLNRLTTDKYFANCDDCGDEIEYKRLIFIPTARRCVHCQQNAEKK